MATVGKVIKMLNKCNSSFDVQCVWTTVCTWSMSDEEFAQVEAIVMAEFAAWE